MAKLGDMSFTYNPTQFPNFKKIALILQKFGIGHVPMRIIKDTYSNEETFYFAEKIGGKYEYDETITVHLNSDDTIGTCTVDIGNEQNINRAARQAAKPARNFRARPLSRNANVKKKLNLKYEGFDVYVSRELKDRFSPFLDHANAAFRGFKIRGSGKCNIDPITDEFKNANACLANVKFFENSAKLWLPLIKGIASSSVIEDYANININQFGKLKGKINILETLHPQSDETINHVLDGFKFMKDNDVSNFICGPISCVYTKKTQWNSIPKIEVKLGGIKIIREHSLERFRYMFHPALHLIAHILKQDELLNTFMYSIQKQVFRSI